MLEEAERTKGKQKEGEVCCSLVRVCVITILPNGGATVNGG